jgi:hypothetical protein
MKKTRGQSRMTAATQATVVTSGGIVTAAAANHPMRRASPYPSQMKEPN